MEEDIATAQLENNNTDGRENWRRIIDGYYHRTDVGQAITLDAAGNVYVAGRYDGSQTVRDFQNGFATVSYTPQGARRWMQTAISSAPAAEATSIALSADGSTYVYGRTGGANILRYDSDGQYVWGDAGFGSIGTKLLIDHSSGRVFATGRGDDNGLTFQGAAILTVFDSNGNRTQPWSYPGLSVGRSEGVDIAWDSTRNLYVAGYSANDQSSDAIFIAKLTMSGQQLVLDRYNSPDGGNSYPVGMVIDTIDSVYVTGFNVLASGASEFVTIKYVAGAKIESKQNGMMHLEFRATPNQPYAIETTSDFIDWRMVTSGAADASGVMRYVDTNVTSDPFRFYRGKEL